MTEVERKQQWKDPFIQELLMDLKATIMTRYLHQPTPRKKVIALSAGRIQDKRVSATG